jgi:hypothetical protein
MNGVLLLVMQGPTSQSSLISGGALAPVLMRVLGKYDTGGFAPMFGRFVCLCVCVCMCVCIVCRVSCVRVCISCVLDVFSCVLRIAC